MNENLMSNFIKVNLIKIFRMTYQHSKQLALKKIAQVQQFLLITKIFRADKFFTFVTWLRRIHYRH